MMRRHASILSVGKNNIIYEGVTSDVGYQSMGIELNGVLVRKSINENIFQYGVKNQ